MAGRWVGAVRSLLKSAGGRWGPGAGREAAEVEETGRELGSVAEDPEEPGEGREEVRGMGTTEDTEGTERTTEEVERGSERQPGGEGAEVGEEVGRLRAQVEEATRRGVESHRRALLAENAGRVVPELVRGSTVEELDGSLEAARAAFDSAKAAVLREIGAAPVSPGNAARAGADVESMSPLEKIAYGLRRE